MARRIAARRYANALFALSSEQAAIDAVHADLTHLAGLLHRSEAWRVFVTEPAGAKELRAGAIQALLRGKTHALTEKFVAFLDHKSRITIFPDLVDEWTAIYDQHKQLMRIKVVSARPLMEAQKQNLIKRLGQRFGKNIIMTEEIDSAIIGGLRIHAGDQVYDYSIETQLIRLQKTLTYA